MPESVDRPAPTSATMRRPAHSSIRRARSLTASAGPSTLYVVAPSAREEGVARLVRWRMTRLGLLALVLAGCGSGTPAPPGGGGPGSGPGGGPGSDLATAPSGTPAMDLATTTTATGDM